MKPFLFFVGVGVVLLIVGIGVVVWLTAGEVEEATISSADFAAVTAGMSKDQVEAALGVDTSEVDYAGQQPPVPREADCDYYIDEDNQEQIYRICFQDGEVVQTVTFRDN